MFHLPRLFLSLALLLPLAPAARARGDAPGFLGARELEAAVAALPQPPAEGSIGAQADLEAVLQAQAWRSDADAAWARAVDRQTAFLLAPALDRPFAPGSLPRVEALLLVLKRDIHAASSLAKRRFQRTRPYRLDPRVKPCVELPSASSFSYPSGHSLQAFTWAQVLGEVFPERREALLERAHRMAWGRILGGVHFPSDDVGGRLFAERLLEALRRSPAFREAVAACRQEAEALALRRAG